MRKDVASSAAFRKPPQNFRFTSITLSQKNTVEVPVQKTLRGPASRATCAKDRISLVSIQSQECWLGYIIREPINGTTISNGTVSF